MNRIQLTAVLVIAAIAVLTGWIYWTTTKQQLVIPAAPVEEEVEEEEESGELEPVTYVLYSKEVVAGPGEDGLLGTVDDDVKKTYLVWSGATGTTFELTDDQIAMQVERPEFWQSADGSVVVTADFTYPEGAQNPAVAMRVAFPTKARDEDDRTVLLDPAELGIELGYAWPVAVSADGNSVYLKQIFEGEGWFSGFWKYAVGSGTFTRCEYCDQFALKMPAVSIGGSEDLLIGSAFAEPDSLDLPTVGPSALHLVTLSARQGQEIMADADRVFFFPTLSPSGKLFSFNYASELPTPDLWIFPVVGERTGDEQRIVQGTLLAWIDDQTIVVDRQGEIVVVDLTTRKAVAIDRNVGSYYDSDYQRVQFVKITTLD